MVQFGSTDYYGSLHLTKFFSSRSLTNFNYFHTMYQNLLKESSSSSSLKYAAGGAGSKQKQQQQQLGAFSDSEDEQESENDRKAYEARLQQQQQQQQNKYHYKTDKLSIDIVEVILLNNILSTNYSFPKTHFLEFIVEMIIKCPSLDECLNLFIRKLFEEINEMNENPYFLVSSSLTIVNHFHEKQYLSIPFSSPSATGGGSNDDDSASLGNQRMKRQQILSILKSAIMNEYEISLEIYILLENRNLPFYSHKASSSTSSASSSSSSAYYNNLFQNENYERYRESSSGILTMKRKYKLTYVDGKDIIKCFTRYPIESIISGVFYNANDANLCVSTYLNHVKSLKRKKPASSHNPPPPRGGGKNSKKGNKKEAKEDEDELKEKASLLMNDYISSICYSVISSYHSGEFYQINERMILLQSIFEKTGNSPAIPLSGIGKGRSSTSKMKNSLTLDELMIIPTHLPRNVAAIRSAIYSFLNTINVMMELLHSTASSTSAFDGSSSHNSSNYNVLTSTVNTLAMKKVAYFYSKFPMFLLEFKKLIN
jgi:hypothetical protein